MPISTVGLTNAVNGILPVANGGTGSSSGIFPTGTAMLFQQTTAPTGWTKVTTYNDYALRIVSGTASTGGSVGFTTAFSSQNVGATTLSTSQIPAHSHVVPMQEGTGSTAGGGTLYYSRRGDLPYQPVTTTDTGSGGSHTHSLNIAVNYVDCIIATKA